MNRQLLFLLFYYFNIVNSNLIYATEHKKSCIDRKALIYRHTPVLTRMDTLSPFSVGNGEFAFTIDITGLQTFAELYENGIPLGIQTQWGWHTVPNPNHYSLDQTFKYYDTYGRSVFYASKQHSEAGQWLRANPHKLHLGKIGFRIKKTDSSEIEISDLTDIHQTADIWEGIIKSSFMIKKNRIEVETACHPEIGQIAVRVKSGPLEENHIGITFDFPYGSLSWGPTAEDWGSPEKHISEIISL